MGLAKLRKKLKLAVKVFKEYDNIRSVVTDSSWECSSPSAMEAALSGIQIKYFDKECREFQGAPKAFGKSPI